MPSSPGSQFLLWPDMALRVELFITEPWVWLHRMTYPLTSRGKSL